MFEFLCDVDQDTKNYITALLPQRKSRIVEVSESKQENLSVRLYTDLKDGTDAAEWVQQFQTVTKAFYSIRSTSNTTGRFVNYKQVLNCQRNTRIKLKDLTEHPRTKNTDCPARIVITLHAIKKRYQGRNLALYKLRKEMPCEIFLVLTHNHDLQSADSLKYRRISSELKERLLKLYQSGHSPKSAQEIVRKHIILHSDDPQSALADRSQFPDYTHCYHLYKKHLKGINKRPFGNEATTNNLLEKRLDEYNAETDGNSVQMIMYESDYVICICTPLMKCVHKYIRSASELAYVDSSAHHGKCRVFVILTHSDCGGLPLAVIVTSSENSEVLCMGFQMMETMLGEEMFGGHPEGPKVFFTGDSQAEQVAVKDIWKGSECYISITLLLQSVWAWLNKPANNIPTEQCTKYFEGFKSILYSTTVDDAYQRYYTVRKDACNDPSFILYLDIHWQTKEQWVLAYRSNSTPNTNNLSEAIMKLIKDKLFDRVKSFNVVQVVDFLLTTFVEYYGMRLLEAAKNHLQKNIFGRLVERPSAELLDKIKILDANTVLVPCDDTAEDLHYMVNVDALRCTCSKGVVGKLCSHIDLACTLLHSENFNTNVDKMLPRKMLYRIATGKEPPYDWLSPLWGEDECFTCPETSPDCEAENSTDENDLQSDMEGTEEKVEECLGKGQNAIRQLSYILEERLRMNLTNSVVEALEKMCENAKQLCTSSELESACSKFGRELDSKHAEGPVQSAKKRKLNPSTRSTNVPQQPILQIPVSAHMIKSEIDPSDNTKPRIAPKIQYVLVQAAPMVMVTGKQ